MTYRNTGDIKGNITGSAPQREITPGGNWIYHNHNRYGNINDLCTPKIITHCFTASGSDINMVVKVFITPEINPIPFLYMIWLIRYDRPKKLGAPVLIFWNVMAPWYHELTRFQITSRFEAKNKVAQFFQYCLLCVYFTIKQAVSLSQEIIIIYPCRIYSDTGLWNW